MSKPWWKGLSDLEIMAKLLDIFSSNPKFSWKSMPGFSESEIAILDSCQEYVENRDPSRDPTEIAQDIMNSVIDLREAALLEVTQWPGAYNYDLVDAALELYIDESSVMGPFFRHTLIRTAEQFGLTLNEDTHE